MFKIILTILVSFKLNLSNALIKTAENSFSSRKLGQSLALCLGENNLIKCLDNKILSTLDVVIANNETWQLSDFLMIEKNYKTPNILTNNQNHFDELLNVPKENAQQVALIDMLALKMLQLAQTRSLRIQLPSSSINKLFNKRSISTDLNANDENDNDIGAIGRQLEQVEGRKKKYKDKNMAMMGGMAMLALVAQMFLGKVILIAGAAFVMAKVALLISTLGSLKKGTSGNVGGTDHVIVTGSGVSSGHSSEHISGWHRRIPYEHSKFETLAKDQQTFKEPIKYYEAAENNYLKKRNPYNKTPKQNNLNKINI